MALKGISVARLKTLYQRQSNPSWDSNYVPGILATPQEAPSISRASILTPAKLEGRETHLLSPGEVEATLLGLYYPQMLGLQEQRMLSPEPAVHPLWTFPEIDRSALRPLKGTIDVAERLGLLEVLPRILVPHPESPEKKMSVVYPWCGDLLWAIAGPEVGPYCVNWSIKNKREDFGRRISRHNGKQPTLEMVQRALARHEIERMYYEDCGIRTVHIAREVIDPHVAANLRQLFLHHRRELSLNAEQQGEILDKFRTALQLGITPADVITVFVQRGRYSIHQCRSAFYQAIWYRQLRLDLFRPILINRPMRPESRDVVDVYAEWFREGP